MENKKRKPKNAHIAARIGGVIICILLSVAAITAIIFTILGGITSKTTIKRMLGKNSTDIAMDIAKDKVTGDVDLDELSEIDGVDDLIASQTSEMLEYILTGEGDPIDKDEIMDFIKENKDDIEDSVGDKVDMKKVEKQLDEFIDEMEETYDDEIKETMEPVQFVFDGSIAIYGFIVAGVLLVILFIIFIKYIDKSFGYSGVTFFVTGIVLAIIGVVEGVAISSIKDIMDDMDAVEEAGLSTDIVEGLISSIQVDTYMWAGIVAVVGIAFFIIGIILKNLRAKKEAYAEA